MAGASRARIYLSVHHQSAQYLEKLRPALALLKQWRKDHGVRVYRYESFKHWRRSYRGAGAQMEPFADGRPRESWERCMSKDCPQLFEGEIWKCPPLACLGMQKAKHGLSAAWQPYLDYRPLEPDGTDEAMREFFAREAESMCNMCPAGAERFALPLPLVNRTSSNRELRINVKNS